MEFLCTRTSEWYEKPCEEAYEKEFFRVDVRYATKPEDIPCYKNNPSKWYEEGENHRVEGGKIKRDLKNRGWFIAVESLEELVTFIKKHGRVIVSVEDNSTIEIYDDYRE